VFGYNPHRNSLQRIWPCTRIRESQHQLLLSKSMCKRFVSTYINEVFPIWLSPTIPTFNTTLLAIDRVHSSVLKRNDKCTVDVGPTIVYLVVLFVLSRLNQMVLLTLMQSPTWYWRREGGEEKRDEQDENGGEVRAKCAILKKRRDLGIKLWSCWGMWENAR